MRVANIENSEYIKGNVKITLLSKGSNKVIKEIRGNNTGTINVCEYLRDALMGDYVINRRPGILIPCTYNGRELVNINNGYPYQGNSVALKINEGDTGCSMKLTFIISSELEGTKIYGFKLCSVDSQTLDKDSKIVYAEILVTTNEEEAITITNNANLKVEWTISVMYK